MVIISVRTYIIYIHIYIYTYIYIYRLNILLLVKLLVGRCRHSHRLGCLPTAREGGRAPRPALGKHDRTRQAARDFTYDSTYQLLTKSCDPPNRALGFRLQGFKVWDR